MYQHCMNKVGMKCMAVGGKLKMYRHVLTSSIQPEICMVNSHRCQDEDGKEIQQNEKGTCRACGAFVFAQ